MESTRTSAGTSDQSTLIAITAAGSSLFLHIPSGQICLLLDLSASYWIKPPFALRYLSDFPQNCFHVLPKITTQGKKTQERSLTIQGCKLPTCHPNRAAPTLRLLCCHWHTLTKGESFIAITAEFHTVILGKPVGCVCCSHAQHYRSCTAICTLPKHCTAIVATWELRTQTVGTQRSSKPQWASGAHQLLWKQSGGSE